MISRPADNPKVSFNLNAANISAAALRANAISPITASATGSYQGNTVRLASLSARNAQNLDFSGSGTIPLSGSGLSLHIKGKRASWHRGTLPRRNAARNSTVRCASTPRFRVRSPHLARKGCSRFPAPVSETRNQIFG